MAKADKCIVPEIGVARSGAAAHGCHLRPDHLFVLAASFAWASPINAEGRGMQGRNGPNVCLLGGAIRVWSKKTVFEPKEREGC